MIRMTGRLANGIPFLLLGVDDENIKRLTSGQPIRCAGHTVGIDGDVLIVHGKTLDDVKDTLAKAGIPIPVNDDAR